jgi:hypothetical protein
LAESTSTWFKIVDKFGRLATSASQTITAQTTQFPGVLWILPTVKSSNSYSSLVERESKGRKEKEQKTKKLIIGYHLLQRKPPLSPSLLLWMLYRLCVFHRLSASQKQKSHSSLSCSVLITRHKDRHPITICKVKKLESN